MPADAPRTGPHVLTFNLEDYFQVGAFNKYVREGQWDRFETRLAHHAHRTLDLLDQYPTKATFFVLGWVAEHFPQLVRELADRGHEVASRGYWHRNISDLGPEEFREDLAKAKESLERACGRQVVGYRSADGWFRRSDLWALDVLAEEGYAYDSSVAPLGRRYAGESWRRFKYQHETPHGPIWELPVSARRILGFDLPIGGGNWVRQLPAGLMQRAARRWAERDRGPLVMYFQTWELDDEQPRLSTGNSITRIRQYRNLDCMEERVVAYLKQFAFAPAATHLGVERAIVVPAPLAVETPAPAVRATIASIPMAARTPVTIVVPLYNEEDTIRYLGNTLDRVRTAFAADYDLKFILVDDGSQDKTWELTETVFGTARDIRRLRHEGNKGVAAAIMTGLRAAETEVVCSIDADCTYEPLQLLKMIPKLTPDVDLVTASPYHPSGSVRNVPRWRLILSKGASRLYRQVFYNRLHTYTSCFRVYRRSAVQDVPVQAGNFLGVVELLGRLDLNGSRVVEHPAVLEVRMLGRSKMKTVRTIIGHLGLMARFARHRLFRRGRAHSRQERDHALLLLIGTAREVTCHAALGQQSTMDLVVTPAPAPAK